MGMNRTFKAAVAALMLAAGFAGSVPAAPIDDAVAAYARGDYATTMRLLRPLADQGGAEAQRVRAYMYAQGQGVPRDYAAAVSWSRKAADLARNSFLVPCISRVMASRGTMRLR
jgi:TPR repeat protein